jgi:U4/U6.U5 tri-snRNP-associated protein 1
VFWLLSPTTWHVPYNCFLCICADGRLLTRKEAFRDLSYQFHGYGSGKRKEEKKKEQISREQAEARQAADGKEAGTFGAVKNIQKATGKAFIIHKT